MKRITKWITVALLVLNFTWCAAAAEMEDPYNVMESETVGSEKIEIYLDGLRIPLNHPIAIQDHTIFVPGEELFTAMGAQNIQHVMNGDGVHKVLSGVKNFDDGTGNSFYYTEGIDEMVVNSWENDFVYVDTPPQIIDGVFMLPLELVDYTMRVQSAYNSGENRVYITTGGFNYADVSCQKDIGFSADKFIAKHANELDDNRIGQLWGGVCSFTVEQLDGLANYIITSGTTRARTSVYPIDSGRSDCGLPETEAKPDHDAFFTRLASNGVKDTIVLSFWDYAHRAATGERLPIPRFQTQEEIDRYLDYARFTVNRFRKQIQYFELWNEWNIHGTEQSIELPDYINLAKQAARAIHEVNPDAKVVVGSIAAGLDPQNYSLEDLMEVLRSDVMPLADVVCIEPLFGASPEFGAEIYYGFEETIQTIKTTAFENGFQGEFFCGPVNHYYAMDQPGALEGTPMYTPMKVAKYYAREAVRYLGLDLSIEISERPAEIIKTTISNLCTIMAGAKAEDVQVDIECGQSPLSDYVFSLPNGDTYVAVWWDGAAEDTDVKILADITVLDIAASSVSAIDPVYGFEQALKGTVTSQGTLLENIVLRDYPLIIRLTP